MVAALGLSTECSRRSCCCSMSRSICCSRRRCWRSLRLRRSSYLLRCRLLVELVGDICPMTVVSRWHDAIREDCGCCRCFRSLAVAIEADDPRRRQIARGGTFAPGHTQTGPGAGCRSLRLPAPARCPARDSNGSASASIAARSIGPPLHVRTAASWPSRRGLAREPLETCLVSLAGAGQDPSCGQASRGALAARSSTTPRWTRPARPASRERGSNREDPSVALDTGAFRAPPPSHLAIVRGSTVPS